MKVNNKNPLEWSATETNLYVLNYHYKHIKDKIKEHKAAINSLNKICVYYGYKVPYSYIDSKKLILASLKNLNTQLKIARKQIKKGYRKEKYNGKSTS